MNETARTAGAGTVVNDGRAASIAVPILVALVALALPIVGALITSEPTTGVNQVVEGASTAGSTFFGGLSQLLPFGFAFGAGMASSVNPCGFVMLPAYLGLLVGDQAGGAPRGTRQRLTTGLLVAGTVTVGFVGLFALVGLLIGFGAQVLVGVFPFIGLAVGVGLVAVGAYRLSGRPVYSSLPEQVASRLQRPGERGVRGYLLFGLAYGIASLSCTLPIFLAVVGGTLTAASLVPSLIQLGLYGLGMGVVISAVTLAVALFSSAAVRGLRGAGRFVDPLGTVLLFVAGSYIVYYWLTIGGLLGGLS